MVDQSIHRMTNLDAPFDLVLDHIAGIKDDFLFSLRDQNVYAQLFSNLKDHDPHAKIQGGLENVRKLNTPALHKFTYDFDLLFSIGHPETIKSKFRKN